MQMHIAGGSIYGSMLRSTRYTGISDRKGKVEEVRAVLEEVIHAQPTQIHPDDREGYLNAILDDLRVEEDATWISWPEDVHLLALHALRILGRNPMGSKCMLNTAHIRTLLYHAALLPPLLPVTPFPTANIASHQKPSIPTIPAKGAASTETLKVLANMLILHPLARKKVTREGGCTGVVLALRGKRAITSEVGQEESAGGDGGSRTAMEDVQGEDTPERVFLLGRLLFLMTANEEAATRGLVEHDEVVDGLVQHLLSLTPIPSNYDAITELFKAANNIVAAYPDGQAWNDKVTP